VNIERPIGVWIAVATAVCSALASGCGEVLYAATKTGAFKGRLVVEWIQPDQFIYSPDPNTPLRFEIAGRAPIQPERMLTDGGSIPRLFWSHPGFGPWDFGPGYIIHDWLFHQHHCKIGNWSEISFEDSAVVLAEAIKTQMEKAPPPQRDAQVVWAIYEAVKSPIAHELWDTGMCETTPPLAPAGPTAASPPSVPIKVYSFGSGP